MESIYKAPDAIGNLFRTPERKDRKYGKGSRLLEDRKYSYHYDGEGNLVMKCRLRPDTGDTVPLWQEGDWAYEWQGNGMLRSVKRPDGEMVSFEYDPLGRRISKTYKDKTTRWVWDGNVPLHEWTEEENVTTWLFEEGTFIPAAKIVGDKSYSIITDYLGTPTEMYNSDGEKTWSAELDIYGSVRTFVGRSLSDCPFRYQGQYEDEETGLYYNRFRYYDPNAGNYISQDPIGLTGNNPTLYGYVSNSTLGIDVLGLVVDNLIRYKPGKVKPRSGGRSTAINRAWMEEQELILRTGKGTRDWTSEEIEAILAGRSGKELTSTMSQMGYTGHHINNVSDFPELQGDPRNIIFLQNANHPSGINEHLYAKQGHRGNYDNETRGRLIDRKHSH